MVTLVTVLSEYTSDRRGASRERVLFAAMLIIVVFSAPPAAAASPPAHALGEGFSSSRRGLPAAARRAWSATVMVVRLEGTADSADGPTLPYSGWGSGLVLSFDEEGDRSASRPAVIATTNHVVRCRRPPCRYAVGFTDPGGQEVRYWTLRTSLEDSSPGNDLAFLSVEVPPQVSPTPPTLADPACHGDDLARTIAVGWPNLTLRTGWNVPPPSNSELLLKRYSGGMRVQHISAYPLRTADLEHRERVPIILHNADLLPGSSGGPLLDEYGRVIGINSRILAPGVRDKYNYCAQEADRHSPGEDCINMAISSQAIADAFGEVFDGRLALEACGGIDNERPLQAAGDGREDAGPEILTESAQR